MTKQELIYQIKKKRSFLCIGLDTDLRKIPKHLLNYDDPIFEFNKQIIDATKDYCVAYKPNIAFYEYLGSNGWSSLEKTISYIPKDIFTIADAKRGDIGNTSSMYAEAFFQNLDFNAITLSPYMGSDSIKPFIKFKNKWVIILALTSNIGGSDFQNLKLETGDSLFQKVLKTTKSWGSENNIMYVIGATREDKLSEIRKIVPEHFLLVPGFGKQGGNLENISKYMMNHECGLLVNSSRGIIYKGSGKDFAAKAAEEAKMIQMSMDTLLATRNI